MAAHQISTEHHEETGQRVPYLPALDGLRALAVIAVLLYHADIPSVSGGFFGVEVFFVLSGYLITALLLAEYQAEGRVNLPRFWLRRMRRLLPALFVLLIVVLAAALAWWPEEVTRLRSEALAALGYLTNWFLVIHQQSYFETIGRPSALEHLWSLAVEEQFYVVWPLFLSLGIAGRGRRGGLIALAGAVASAALMALLYQPDVDPSRIYYGTDTRAAGLLVGAALAFVWAPGHVVAPRSRIAGVFTDLVGLAALTGLIGCIALVGEYNPNLYQGGFFAVALLTAALIAALAHPQARVVGWLLSLAPLRWIGTRSYAIYLWHWPITVVTRPELDVPLQGIPLLALRCILIAILAELSYRLVETPIRTNVLRRAWLTFRASRGRLRAQQATLWIAVLICASSGIIELTVAVGAALPPPPPDYLAEVPQDDSVKADGPIVTTVPTIAPTQPVGLMPTHAEPTATPIEIERMPPADELSTPSASPRPTITARVTAIGDSVMLGAAGRLGTLFNAIDIDARRNRGIKAAITLLQARRVAGTLGDVVVIHIGNNGPLSSRQFDALMTEVADVRRVVVVNLRVPRRWEQNNNDVIQAGILHYPNTVLLDWHTASANRPEIFWHDRYHLRPAGAEVYADLIEHAVDAPQKNGTLKRI